MYKVYEERFQQYVKGPATRRAFLAGIEFSHAVARAEAVGEAVTNPEEADAIVRPLLAGREQEVFIAILLNTKNRVIDVVEVSRGSLNASIVHPRELFREAVRQVAASVVVAHNHPSGDPKPSSADILLTERLAKAGEVLGIEVLDHVVIGGPGRYASLRDMGLMR